MTAIRTTDLCRTFGDVRAVDHMNLCVEEGEIYALLGVNGAGKTTTIRMLSCLLKPDSGDAELLGHSIVHDPAAVKRIINVSPQETAVGRLSIAMALVSRPKILFLDEPTLGLDVLARRALWKFIERLRGEMTVILTTHAMDEAQALSDHVGIVSKGTLRAFGTVNELMERTGAETFEDAFVRLVSEEAER